MASQPITTARRHPHRRFGFDHGVILVAIALVCHWYHQTAWAVALGILGTLAIGLGSYWAFQDTQTSPVSEGPTRPDTAATPTEIERLS